MSYRDSGGWHSDPTGRWEARYWDGHQWTEHVRTGSHVGIDPAERQDVVDWTDQDRPMTGAGALPPKKTRSNAFIGLMVCLALGFVATIGGALASGEDDKKPVATKRTTTSRTALPTTHATTTTVPPTTAPPTTVPPTAAPPVTEAPASVTMPEVVCRNLQDAQNDIQHAGVFYSRSEDATGQGRNQVLDAGWIVVRQSPAAGTPIKEGDPMLYVVRISEPNDC